MLNDCSLLQVLFRVLIEGISQTVLSCQTLYVLNRELGQLLGGFHVRHFLKVTFCEDHVKLFERPVCSLRVEEVTIVSC